MFNFHQAVDLLQEAEDQLLDEHQQCIKVRIIQIVRDICMQYMERDRKKEVQTVRKIEREGETQKERVNSSI